MFILALWSIRVQIETAEHGQGVFSTVQIRNMQKKNVRSNSNASRVADFAKPHQVSTYGQLPREILRHWTGSAPLSTTSPTLIFLSPFYPQIYDDSVGSSSTVAATHQELPSGRVRCGAWTPRGSSEVHILSKGPWRCWPEQGVSRVRLTGLCASHKGRHLAQISTRT